MINEFQESKWKWVYWFFILLIFVVYLSAWPMASYSAHPFNPPLLGYVCFKESLKYLTVPGFDILFGYPSLSNFSYLISIYLYFQKKFIDAKVYAFVSLILPIPFLFHAMGDNGAHIRKGMLVWYGSFLMYGLVVRLAIKTFSVEGEPSIGVWKLIGRVVLGVWVFDAAFRIGLGVSRLLGG